MSPKKKAKTSNSDSDEDSSNNDDVSTEDPEYKRLTLHDHILQRPDSYVGSTDFHEDTLWVVDDNGNAEFREIRYVPALYKIFDEILVNAADNRQRTLDNLKEASDKKSLKYKIQIEINKEEGYISVWNNGEGINIGSQIDQTTGESVPIPQFIFANLLTSSNYNDDEKRIVGGRNGYGAKLANVYSTRFEIELQNVNSSNNKLSRYSQTILNNMNDIHEPVITPGKGREIYTKITFWPQFSLFHMEAFDDDIIALMRRRVYDLAGILPGTTVTLNGSVVPIKNFDDYCKRFLKEDETFVSQQINERWLVGLAPSVEGKFTQISFVNSIATTKGGDHVKYILKQVIDQIEGSNKLKSFKNRQMRSIIKNYIHLFIVCLIENPAFTSQTKEELNLQQSKFGSTCDVSALTANFMKKTSIITLLQEAFTISEKVGLTKLKGHKTARLHGVKKLHDANLAGTKESSKCSLILTEGDSAATMALKGLSVIGQDYYGVFPLKGKMLNTRKASSEKIKKNDELLNLIKIVGLDPSKNYQNDAEYSSLRYGHVIAMADQDVDGSHIKGLILNFFHDRFPSLLKRHGFLSEFITPILKASRGTKTIPFYTLPEFIEWKNEHDNAKGWHVKYYKGLATSDDNETREYFKKFKEHKIDFVYSTNDDDEKIKLAFAEKATDDRKEWLKELDPEKTFIGYQQGLEFITCSEFIDNELILFSNYSNSRSIPNIMDGLKTSQRKILWVCLKTNLKSQIKVAQLAPRVSEASAYHHGEVSLEDTIKGMAQDFVGSNNINLLVPKGQFGSRGKGGKDAGASRYIYTHLNLPIARDIFQKEDDQILTYLTDEGIPVEPRYYVPVIPMILVNGANGIGTGWKTEIPCFNPKDIIANIERYLKGEPFVEMDPWYSGFKGEIIKVGNQKWMVKGTATKTNANQIDITELPIGVWTEKYKQELEEYITPKKSSKGDKGKKSDKGKKGDDNDNTKFTQKIYDIREYQSANSVHFSVFATEEQMAEIEKEGFEKFFKLSKPISTANMYLYNNENKLTKYETPEEILQEFCEVRFKFYKDRKEAIIKSFLTDISRLSNQARFIQGVIDDTIKVRNQPRDYIIDQLIEQEFDPIYAKSGPEKVADDFIDTTEREAEEENEENEENSETDELLDEEEDYEKIKAKRKLKRQKAAKDAEADYRAKGFDYLLSMAIWSLTKERKEKLDKEVERLRKQLSIIEQKTIQTFWSEDIDQIKLSYEKFEQDRLNADKIDQDNAKKTKSRVKINISKSKSKMSMDNLSEDVKDKEEKPKPKAKVNKDLEEYGANAAKPKTPRKRRSREEIEAEKAAKEQRKKEREAKKAEKEAKKNEDDLKKSPTKGKTGKTGKDQRKIDEFVDNDSEADFDDLIDEEEEKSKPSPIKPRQRNATKKTSGFFEDSDDDDDDDDDDESDFNLSDD